MMSKIVVGPSDLKNEKCRRRGNGRTDIRDPITTVAEGPRGWKRIARGALLKVLKLRNED